MKLRLYSVTQVFLVFLLAFFLFSVGLVYLLVFDRFGEVISRLEKRFVEESLKANIRIVEEHINDRIRLLKDYATLPAVTGIVMHPDENLASGLDFLHALHFLEHKADFMVTDFSGDVLVRTGDDLPILEAEVSRHLQEVLTAHHIHTGLHRDVDGFVYWVFAVPVRFNGFSEGALMVRYPFIAESLLDLKKGEAGEGVRLSILYEGRSMMGPGSLVSGWEEMTAEVTDAVSVRVFYDPMILSRKKKKLFQNAMMTLGIGMAGLIVLFYVLGRKLFVEPQKRLQELTANLDVTNQALKQEIAEKENAAAQLLAESQRVEASETRLQAILETAPVGIVAITTDGIIRAVNPAVRSILGYGQEELIGKRVDCLMPEPYRSAHQGYLEAYLESGIRKMIGIGREVEARHKNGDRVPIHLAVGEVQLDSQKMFTGILSDLTETRALEQDRRFKAFALDNTSDGIFWIDRNGHFVYANDAAMRLLEVKDETTCRNMTVCEVVESLNAEAWHVQWQGLLQNDHLDFRTRLRTRTGNMVPAEVTLTFLEFEGQAYCFAYARDITERIEREEEVKKLSFVASRTDNAVVITDAAGRIEWVNEGFCSITGYTLEEVKGSIPGRLLQGPETDGETVRRIAAALEHQESFQGELLNYRKDGTSYWLQVAINPVFDDGGALTGFIAIESDISERKSAELALREARTRAEAASRSKSDFLASMSHEIRTPLNSLIGMAELLTETDLSPEQKRYVGIFQASGNALLCLINDILDLSKIEAGHLHVESVAFDLKALLSELEGIFRFRFTEKNLLFTPVIMPNVPRGLKGDPTRIRQVLVNLIGNAVKFTENGGVTLTVQVQDSEDGPLLRFAVADTGIGIAGDKVGQIFERFTQADTSTTRKYGGTGLGLAICQKLVLLMGGDIRVTSTLHVGSTFSFDIPLVPAGENWQPEEEANRENKGVRSLDGTVFRDARILLVDDFPDNRFLVRSHLRTYPFVIVEADNGKKAVSTYKEGGFDLVLMDIQMPEMDGVAAISEIRKWEKEESRNPVPILTLSAHALASEEERCRLAGADGYMTKPIRKQVLLEGLFAYLAKEGGGVPEVVSDPPEETEDGDLRRALEELDPVILEMVPMFLEKREQDMAEIPALLEKGAFDEIRILGHNMKGTGGSYGFDLVTEIGSRIEKAAQAADRDAIAKEREALAHCVKTGRHILSDMLL